MSSGLYHSDRAASFCTEQFGETNQEDTDPRWSEAYYDIIIDQTQVAASVPRSNLSLTSESSLKLYPCTFPKCQRTFKNSSTMRYVTRPKPCESADIRSSKHSKSHFRELRTFVCSECFQRFSYDKDLKRHIGSIHERAEFKYCSFSNCDRASRGFARKDKRDEHEKKIHGASQMADSISSLKSQSVCASDSDLDKLVVNLISLDFH